MKCPSPYPLPVGEDKESSKSELIYPSFTVTSPILSIMKHGISSLLFAPLLLSFTYHEKGWTMLGSPTTNEVWIDIITGKTKYQFEFLALKIMLGRLLLQYSQDPTPENAEHCAVELCSMLQKNSNIPSVQRDLIKILGGGGN